MESLTRNIQIRNKNPIISFKRDAQVLLSKGISFYKQKKFSRALNYFLN